MVTGRRQERAFQRKQRALLLSYILIPTFTAACPAACPGFEAEHAGIPSAGISSTWSADTQVSLSPWPSGLPFDLFQESLCLGFQNFPLEVSLNNLSVAAQTGCLKLVFC